MSEARMAPNGPGQGAEREPWWGQLLVEYAAGASLRALARQFSTTPRRIRRAMARTGVRAHGRQLSNRGVPELVPFLARVGKEPDAVVARAAGVTPEAVAGERARLGLAPFRPAARAHLTRDDEAWIRGPVRRPREKTRVDADLLVVRRTLAPESRPSLVRRPAHAASEPTAPQRAPQPEVDGGARTFRGAAAVVVVRPGVDAPSVHAPRAPETPPGAPPVRPASTSATARAFFEERERRQRELEELLNAPRRERDQSRSRLVRGGETRLIEPEPEPQREVAVRRRPSGSPTWRAVDPEAQRRMELEAERAAEAAAREARRRAEAMASVVPPRPTPPAAAPSTPRAAAHVRPAAPAGPPVPESLAPPRSATPRSSPPAAQPASAALRPGGFRVWFGGLGEPVEVRAADVAGAIVAARGLVPGWPFEITGVERSA